MHKSRRAGQAPSRRHRRCRAPTGTGYRRGDLYVRILARGQQAIQVLRLRTPSLHDFEISQLTTSGNASRRIHSRRTIRGLPPAGGRRPQSLGSTSRNREQLRIVQAEPDVRLDGPTLNARRRLRGFHSTANAGRSRLRARAVESALSRRDAEATRGERLESGRMAGRRPAMAFVRTNLADNSCRACHC